MKSNTRLKKAIGLKASTIRRLIRTGMTIGAIAAMHQVTRKTLYTRFGDAIKGLSKRGRRAAK